MQSLLSFVFGAAGGATLIFLLKTYFTEKIKSKIKHDYDVRLAQQMHEHNMELEKVKKQLERQLNEAQIRFAKFYQDRSDEIRTLHDNLLETEAALDHLTTLGQGADWFTDTEREQNARSSHAELLRLIKKSRIFLPDALLVRLTGVSDNCHEVINEMSTAKTMARMGIAGNERESPLNIWAAQRNKVRDVIKPMTEEVAKDFRSILDGE